VGEETQCNARQVVDKRWCRTWPTVMYSVKIRTDLLLFPYYSRRVVNDVPC